MKNKMSTMEEMVEPSDKDEIENDHEAKSHMHTLMEAESIKSNPEKMAKVHKLAGHHATSIKSIQDLKNVFDKKFGRGALKKPKKEKPVY